MTETDAKQKRCPFIAISLTISAAACMNIAAQSKSLSVAEKLLGDFSSDDKNCIASRCMMWDRKRKDCGMKK
jgi:hypothetical protein